MPLHAPSERLTIQIARLDRRIADPQRFSAAEIAAMQAQRDDLAAQLARIPATAAQE